MENLELEAIIKLLNNSKVYGAIDLTPECVLSAMDYLKANPEATIEEACNFGLNEWIK